MNHLMKKILHRLYIRGFLKKEAEPETGDREKEIAPDDSDTSAEFDEVIRQVNVCTRELQHACKKVDKDFLGIGERLQTIHGQAGDLTSKASFTVELLGSESAENVLSRVTKTAAEALEELARKQDHVQENLEQVLRLGDQLQKLHAMGEQLKSIARFLKMVGINISIESSRSDEEEETFSVLAKEIRELAVTVTQVTQVFLTDTNSVHTHLVTMHQEMSTKLDRFQQLSGSARQSIEHTAPILHKIIQRSVASMALVSKDAQIISQSVADIVMSLQIHDNVSQRVEHIAEALTEIELGGVSQPSDGDPAGHGDIALPALAATLELQIAQLEQVVKDVNDAHRIGEQAFEKINRTIVDIAQNMSIVKTNQSAYASNEASSPSSSEALKKALEEIHTMFGRGNDMVTELQGITHDATAAVSRITRHMDQVREVNFDIHLKSLNAMFKSIRLGSRGKAIEKLVQEMKDVANQSDAFLGQVNGINDTILDAAKTLQDQFERSGDEGGPAYEEENTDFDTCIRDFSSACTSFKQHAAETVTMCHQLSDLIEQTTSELSFVKTFAGDLEAQLEQLRTFHRRILPSGETDRSHLALKKAQIAASYTMQQERDIHNRMLGQGNISMEDEAIASQESDDGAGDAVGEVFDDNIELF